MARCDWKFRILAVWWAAQGSLACANREAEPTHPESRRLLVDLEWDGSLRVTTPSGEQFVQTSIGLLEATVAGGVRDPEHAQRITSRCLSLAHGVRLTREEPLAYVGVEAEWRRAERYASDACRTTLGSGFRVPTSAELLDLYRAVPYRLAYTPETMVALHEGQPALVRFSRPGCRAPFLLDRKASVDSAERRAAAPSRVDSASQDPCLRRPEMSVVSAERAKVLCRGPAAEWSRVTKEEVVQCAERFSKLGGVDPRWHAPLLPPELGPLAFDVHTACTSTARAAVWEPILQELKLRAGTIPLKEQLAEGTASGDSARWQYVYFLNAILETAMQCMRFKEITPSF